MSDYSYGYDFEPQAGGGSYLALKGDGAKALIRLVSEPLNFLESYEVNGKPVTKRSFAWIVLHKEKQDDGTITATVKTYKAGAAVYGMIRDLKADEEWGDPINYDILVKRSGSGLETKYSVTPRPPLKPLTADEKKMVKEADFDLIERYVKAENAPAHGDGDVPHSDPFDSDDD